MSKAQRIINPADVPLKVNGDGKSFQARIGRVGPALGLTGLRCGSGEVRLDDRALPVRPAI